MPKLRHVGVIANFAQGDHVGGPRTRFDREVQRLLAYPVCALVVESDWPTLEQGDWRSDVTPSAVLGSVLGWIVSGLPVLLCGDRERAGRYVSPLCSPQSGAKRGLLMAKWSASIQAA